MTHKSMNPLHVGNNVFIRTVTYFSLGRIVEETELGFVLDKACWVADTGRFENALRTGKLSELELFPSHIFVSKASIVDATTWLHALPTESL